jgi:YaiO family outer membrane protein
VLEELRSYKEAGHSADSVLRIDNKNVDARVIKRRIQDYISENRIGLKYDYVYFDEQFNEPWQLLAVDYTRQTRTGSVTGRINYANRFASNGLQFEVDAYPRISKTFYAYVNAGYGHNLDTSDVFPKWRTGVSLFANLPSAFEAELGVRYLYFSSGTDFYTAYIGKYIGNFLLGARTYLTPAANKSSHSYNLTARYYFGSVDDYVNLLVGYGISPDDRAVAPQLIVADLKTYKAEAIFRKSIRRLNIISVNASIANQEFAQGPLIKRGNQFQFGVGYIRRF